MIFPRLLPFALLLCIGCGDGLSVAPIAGTITFEGRPLAGATVTTQPIGNNSQNPGPGSFGRTDDQGHYELELVQPARKGAIVGEHRVMISKAQDAGSAGQPQQSADGTYEFWSDDPRANRQAAAGPAWPAHLTDGSLRLEVPPEGNDQANFDLKARP